MHNPLLSVSIWFQHWNLDFCRLETRPLLFFIIINDINIVVAFVVIMCKVRPTWGWNWTCGDTSRDGLCLGPIQSESFMRLSQALLYLHCDPGSKLAKKVNSHNKQSQQTLRGWISIGLMAFLIMDFFDKVSKKILPVKAELQKKWKGIWWHQSPRGTSQ